MPEPGVGVDIHMRSKPRRSRCEKSPCKCKRLRACVVSRAGTPRSFVLDPVDEPWTHFVAIPRHAPVRFVEMRMTFDEPGQDHRTLAVFTQHVGAAPQVRPDFFDPAAGYSDIHRGAVRQTDIGDQQAGVH